MNMLKRIHTALFASVLFTCCIAAHADDLQDANKLFKQGQQAPALDKVNSYLSSKPKDAQGRFLKGLILTEQGKPNDAIKIFSDLTSDYPDLPEPYNNLAVLYASQGQYEKAKQSLEQAIRTHPSYATAHENLGDIYAKMASQAYDRALQLDHSNTSTQTKLAMIQDLFSGNARPKAGNSPRPVATKPYLATQPVAEPVTSNISDNSSLLSNVQAWAAAWSAQNVDKYLAAYADDFHPADGESHSAWVETRRERVSNPRYIKVTLSNISVEMLDGTHANVHFKQLYNASHLRSTGHKTLSMVKVNGKWLIQAEQAK